MKIKIIILGMAASLLLPLAGAYARVAPERALDVQSTGNGLTLPQRSADDGATGRRDSKDNGKKGSRGSKGSKGSKGSASPS
ncbi:MAG: hypothetical protein OEM99_03340 [Gammaproteobacteria bacterium]|nr:hypothetical protein [Gammaproteobacteria bacterium]